MEITIKQTVEEKVNIELPYFSKSSIGYYKIISESEVLEIDTFYIGVRLLTHVPNFAINDNHIKITEQEFFDKFIEINGLIGAKLQ